jgi:hypothetical protein
MPPKRNSAKPKSELSQTKRFFNSLYDKYVVGSEILRVSKKYVPTIMSDLANGYEPKHRVFVFEADGSPAMKKGGVKQKTKIQPLYIEVTKYFKDGSEEVKAARFNFPSLDVSEKTPKSKSTYSRPHASSLRMVWTGELSTFFPVFSDNYKNYSRFVGKLAKLRDAVIAGNAKLDVKKNENGKKLSYLKRVLDYDFPAAFKSAYGTGSIEKAEKVDKPASEIPQPRGKSSGRMTSPGKHRAAKPKRKSAPSSTRSSASKRASASKRLSASSSKSPSPAKKKKRNSK